MTLTCPDQSGIGHAVSGLIVENDGNNIIDSVPFGDAAMGLFACTCISARVIRAVTPINCFPILRLSQAIYI